jgi:IS1 family transposase
MNSSFNSHPFINPNQSSTNPQIIKQIKLSIFKKIINFLGIFINFVILITYFMWPWYLSIINDQHNTYKQRVELAERNQLALNRGLAEQRDELKIITTSLKNELAQYKQSLQVERNLLNDFQNQYNTIREKYNLTLQFYYKTHNLINSPTTPHSQIINQLKQSHIIISQELNNLTEFNSISVWSADNLPTYEELFSTDESQTIGLLNNQRLLDD